MRCILCERLSFYHICKKCQKSLLKPTVTKRKLFDDFWVYSFYGYKNIEKLLKTKHHFLGSFVFKILAENSFKIFSEKFEENRKIYVIPVDDKIKENYSHTAILAKSMENRIFVPCFNSLIAKNQVSYSAKSYEYRIKNPRDFVYKGPKNKDVIVVDDIVTTGFTLKEAYLKIKEYANPLFALTLADAKN